MKTITIDSNNDMFVVAKNLQISTGLQACMEVCKQTMLTVFGELMFHAESGTPYFDIVFNGRPNLVAFRSITEKALLEVDGVTGIGNLVASVSGDQLSYSVEISTIYGTATLAS
ncbi:hypothetical protein [Limnohabitans sp.]|uniref:hypothetical protein n=1 Tax=Limnohabitans sp. TaxID=1907725 RepID=UPI00286F7671|nr:hypothetical protein [Limnohabitans sp.]